MFLRFARFCVPSLVGVGLAGLVAAFAETIPQTGSALEASAGAGFVLIFAIPIGFFASVLGRGVLASWRLEELLGAITDERGASPRLAAWGSFLLLSTLVVAFGTFHGIRGLFFATRINTLVALTAPGLVLAILGILGAISKPVIDGLAAVFDRVENRRASHNRVALLTPRLVTMALVAAWVGFASLAWQLLIVPRLGHLDISFAIYIGLFALGSLALPALWPRLGQSVRRVASIFVPAALCGCVIASGVVRYQRPYSMLEIWGGTKVAGWAIDSLYEVQGLRVDLSLEGIEPVAIAGAAHPNVVIITIDTLRADQLGLYGGTVKMAALTELADEGAVFERAYAPGNVTRRSLPTMAIGLSPRRVRGRIAGWALRLDPRHVLLAERFRAGGYDTAGFFCCRSHFGRDHRLGLIRGLDEVLIEYDGVPLTKRAVEWLGKRGKQDKPLFMWTHYIEPHNWVKDQKPKDGSRRSKDRYNRSLKETGDYLKVMIDGIREHLGENTIIVVTSDHGEGLGDHGVKNHAGSLFDTEIRIPLVIAGPKVEKARIKQAVGLVDLAPTLLELAGFQSPGMPQMDGLSVAPELVGTRKDVFGAGEAYSMAVADRSVKEDQSALISGRYKLIERSGSIELYDFVSDPKEKKNIAAEAPELLAAMKARLERRRRLDRVSAF